MLGLILSGCGDSEPVNGPEQLQNSQLDTENESNSKSALGKSLGEVSSPESVDAFDRSQLIRARLEEKDAKQGWINLFDGSTLFGWVTDGLANFRVEDGVLVVDQGERSLLCTSLQWDRYELLVEYRADAETNSGIFLSTDVDPGNVASDCYEVNIAPDSHPYPTGSLVERQMAINVPTLSSDQWHSIKILHELGSLTIEVDGNRVCEYEDSAPQGLGRIGLQHNQGRIEFRKVMLRPLDLDSLLDPDLSAWKKYPNMDATYSINEQGEMHVKGGSGQIETLDTFSDFILLAEYQLPTPEMNSGIFFRCIPGDKMMGYECQVSNFATQEGGLIPSDCGAGGIFRRQDARLIAGETGKWATIVLLAQGPSMGAWVNGIQVSDWTDIRDVDVNPRRGKRLEAGTIMIQGHDPTTDALFRQIRIRSTQ